VKDNVNQLINKAIVIVVIVSGLQFYFVRGLGKLTDALQLFGGFLCIVILILYLIYGEEGRPIKMNFKPLIIILLFSIFPSMIVSAYFHDQSMARAIYEQRDIYFYFLYFLLHRIQLERKFLEKLIFNFGILYCLFYIGQYLLYPTMLFDIKVLEDRNTLRMSLPGIEFALLNYFYSLYRFFKVRQVQYVIAMLLTLTVSILLGGRQVIFMVLFVTMLYLLISRQVKFKPAIIILAISGIVSLYLSFEEVFRGLFMATLETKNIGAENVRIRAIRYFLFEFFPNKWTYIFGNGNPSGQSPYGRAIDRLMMERKFFISDIGMFGVYVYYGIIFVIGSIVLIIRAITLRVSEGGRFIKYYLLMVFQAILTGTGFINSSFIVVYCIMLFLLDVYHEEFAINKPQLDATTPGNLF